MNTLHWLRPEWLWALLPLLLLFTLYWFRLRRAQSAWEQLVDPQLQAYVIEGTGGKRTLRPLLLFVGWLLIILMMAGPVWQQQQVPVYQAQQAEIVLFDLSGSMLSDDIAPNRLTRARFKLADLLTQSEGRQTALIAFSERPYVISPLTEDAETIQAFLPSLDPQIMPVQGSRLDLAIERATTLFSQTGVVEGHIIYIGDASVTEADLQAARAAGAAGHRLSVIGVGTPSGKPLRDTQGRFVRDAEGGIVVPQLNMAELRELAGAAGGRAVQLTTDAADLQALQAVRDAIAIEGSDGEYASQEIYWVEYSPWLLWPLLVVALLFFQRGTFV
ncbi:MAG: VWA domain-containing protein [Granulosicoccus sp.]